MYVCCRTVKLDSSEGVFLSRDFRDLADRCQL